MCQKRVSDWNISGYRFVCSKESVWMQKKYNITSMTCAACSARVGKVNETEFFLSQSGNPHCAGVLFLPFGLRLSPMLGAAHEPQFRFVVTNALRLWLFRPKTFSGPGEEPTGPETINIIREEKQMETVIKVEGMMCTHCKARVEKVCSQVPGCTGAVVDLDAKTVTISGSADVEAVKKAITDAGYEVVG